MSAIFIWPENLNDLDNDQLTQLLTEIRERREKVQLAIARSKKVTEKLTVGALRNQVEKELLKFTKAYDRADRALSEVEKRLSNIMALRLQLEDADVRTDDKAGEAQRSGPG